MFGAVKCTRGTGNPPHSVLHTKMAQQNKPHCLAGSNRFSWGWDFCVDWSRLDLIDSSSSISCCLAQLIPAVGDQCTLEPPPLFTSNGKDDYRKLSNIRGTNSQNLNVSRLVLQLLLPNLLKPGVKKRMKM